MAGTSRPLITRVGTEAMSRSLLSWTGGFDGGLGFRRRCAGGDLCRIETGLGDSAVQGEGGAVGSCKAILPFKYRGSKLEEGGAAGQLGDADSVLRCDHGLRMNGSERVVLENDARLGKIGDELVHVGLRSFAMRALEVSELDEFEILGRRTAIGAVGALLEHGAVLGKGMLAEGNDPFADDDVLLIGRGEEGEAIGLLLAGLVADEDDDLADAGDLGLLDCLNLPHGVGVEAEIGLHEGVDDFLGGRGRR